MPSVADDLRAESRRRLAAMSPRDRLRVALELGEADVALMVAARGLSASAARAAIARSRQVGRVPSPAACPRP